MSTRKRSVIVDDELIPRMALSDRLASANYEVASAGGGAEALTTLTQPGNSFDLIILDLLMPQPNGKAVFRRLKELSIASRTPILILTVVGLEPDIQSMMQQGAFYLQKKYAPTRILDVVQETLREWQRRIAEGR